MKCPQCGKDKFSLDGICLTCNYKVEITDTLHEQESNDNEMKNVPEISAEETSTDVTSPAPQDGIPQWQKELSRRLADIKLKKGKQNIPEETSDEREQPTASAAEDETPKPQIRTFTKPVGSIPVRSENSNSLSSPGKAGTAAPQQRTIASLGPGVYTADKTVQTSDPKRIEELIDSSVSMQSQRPAETPVFQTSPSVPDENKLILLSRTLAGLIDLIIVVLCTTIFIISADYFSGIVILDIVSLIEYAGLFLMIFLLYSIFFLATSGQTVGMMITDLRVIGIQGSRPSIGQLFIRCFGFLLSVIVLGIGLLWSLLDRNNMCLHDRLSNTSVTRL